MSERYVLALYVAGESPRSARAIATLRDICDRYLGEGCDLSVIDVLRQPADAEEQRILATPTLVRQAPPPLRRLIGDFTDAERVVELLDLPRTPRLRTTANSDASAGEER